MWFTFGATHTVTLVGAAVRMSSAVSRFSAANAAETAEEALESARKTEPGIIVLDHGLAGSQTRNNHASMRTVADAIVGVGLQV